MPAPHHPWATSGSGKIDNLEPRSAPTRSRQASRRPSLSFAPSLAGPQVSPSLSCKSRLRQSRLRQASLGPPSLSSPSLSSPSSIRTRAEPECAHRSWHLNLNDCFLEGRRLGFTRYRCRPARGINNRLVWCMRPELSPGPAVSMALVESLRALRLL